MVACSFYSDFYFIFRELCNNNKFGFQPFGIWMAFGFQKIIFKMVAIGFWMVRTIPQQKTIWKLNRPPPFKSHRFRYLSPHCMLENWNVLCVDSLTKAGFFRKTHQVDRSCDWKGWCAGAWARKTLSEIGKIRESSAGIVSLTSIATRKRRSWICVATWSYRILQNKNNFSGICRLDTQNPDSC